MFVPLFIESGTIKVRDAGGSLLVPYNTPSNDTYFTLSRQFDSVAARLKSASFSQAIHHKRQLAAGFIAQHPASIVSVQLLKDYFYLQPDADDTLYYQLLNALDKSLLKLPSSQKMLAEARIRNATAIGRPAPKFVVPDTSQLQQPIYQEGSYTLIDFWASWCMPCRKENKLLVDIFKKYHDKGFTITGISLDTQKLPWLQAIQKDGLPWKQLSDLKGWDSHMIQSYGIKTIPMNYLVNEKGIIIARNLYAHQLEEMLQQKLIKAF